MIRYSKNTMGNFNFFIQFLLFIIFYLMKIYILLILQIKIYFKTISTKHIFF